ncbi:MAG: 3-oxoacyl-[acyl-carrier protein] reductase [Betaproteobacteria bacterium]|nr:3-oxoacyl-[acyl-carrier protein] reductase [Betaproteobacteria bacterium]
MFGSSRLQPIEEHDASGELENVYHDIRQVMRVTGVNLNFRTWAAFERSFPLVWAAVRDNAGTYAFEHAADHLRIAAVQGALALPPLQVLSAVPLGESQTYQIGAALALYHYINPKLLLLTAAIRMVLDNDPINGRLSADVRKLPRGVPARMYPMEMVDESTDDPHLKQTFDDMRQTLGVESIHSDYRTLGLWPYYLASAWQRLKPIAASAEYRGLAESLRVQATDLARILPYRVKLARLDLTSVGEDDDDFIRVTRQLEHLLPGLIVNIALLTLDGTSPDLCMDTPFPVPERDEEPA